MDANLQNDVNAAAAAVQAGDSKQRFVETRARHLSYQEMKNMYPEMSEKDLYRLFRDGLKEAVMTDKKELQQISKTNVT